MESSVFTPARAFCALLAASSIVAAAALQQLLQLLLEQTLQRARRFIATESRCYGLEAVIRCKRVAADNKQVAIGR
jgi:hypothetical protein